MPAITRPIKVFISYAHADTRVMENIARAWGAFDWGKNIAAWSDQKITPGKEWPKEIQVAFDTSEIVVLLISQAFVSSNWCRKETRWALARHKAGTAKVVPVLLEQTPGWGGVVMDEVRLGSLQGLPIDSQGMLKPLSRWTPRNDGYAAVGDGLMDAIQEFRQADPPATKPLAILTAAVDQKTDVTAELTAQIVPALGATISLKRPIITVDFGPVAKASPVTVSEITLDSTNVTAQLVAHSSGRRFFLVPGINLTRGNHTVKIPVGGAVTADGKRNEAECSSTFTVKDRATFDLPLFAGWNLVSFPSDPIDPDINSVFTNNAIDQVVAYDSTDTSSPWRITTRAARSHTWTSSTKTPLTAI